MTISILKPIDMSRGNHTLLYDVVNRGSKRSTDLNIGGNATNPGDGFLEREGYTMAWSGWEGDLTAGIRINLPVARNPNGTAITGRVRSEYVFGSPVSTEVVPVRVRPQVYRRLREAVSAGARAYVVAPLIDESAGAVSVAEVEERVREALTGFPIAVLHGRMPAAERGRCN